MNLNKQEKTALETIRKILDAVENGESITVTNAEQTAIINLTGINLEKLTFRKKQVKSLIRGKNDFKIIFRKPFPDWDIANKVKSHGYFPFQIKEIRR